MKNKKSVLFKSLVSLLLCISMLVGTTFAWFTDSVSTGINTIAAGNLDVELYHTNAVSADEQVKADTNLFLDLQGDPILWEPGVVSYENLRVTNEGDLALAYQLELVTDKENYVIDPSGAQYGLSQILKVGFVEGGITATDRQSVLNSVADANWTTLSSFIQGGSLMPEGTDPDEETWGVVIYWEPGENDNFWNLNNGKVLNEGKVLSIDLGVRLMATQEVYESDSFGSDYDADAKKFLFPDFVGGTASAPVTPDVDNKTSADVNMTAGQAAATVPAGVLLASGASELTLSVELMPTSGANITLGEGEEARSLDVHIEGVAAENTQPITVTLEKAAPVGLNMGNYKLYHVEDSGTNEMTYVDSAANFTTHNQFTYDPATGDITLYMATFSEVAVVADTENAWNGTVATAFAGGDGTENAPYIIANADQLAYFGAVVGGMNDQTQDSFKNKTVKLISDINLGYGVEGHAYKTFYPIGYYNNTDSYEKKSDVSVTSTVNSFEGTFDGQGHTISNFYQNTWEMFGDYNDGYSGTPNHYKDAMGLFGYVVNGKVCNLTVDNFKSDGEFTPTGVIAAYAVNSTFENIAITNCNPRVYNTGNGGIVGIGGNSDDPDTYKLTFTNITIDNSNIISALWGSWDVACGGLVGMFRGDGHVNMTNCHVAARIDVYNDVCGNYQYYWYRYAGMMVGTNKNMTTDANGYTVPETDKFHAENCTVHFGEWNDYYYCELVANSLASYTHDHQFSRLTEISSLDEIKSGDTWTKAGNFLLISGDTKTCYHIVDKNGTRTQHLHTDAGEETVNGETVLKEDKTIVYLPFNQLFTGYGWGVKHIPVYNGEDYAFGGITILDREVADSEKKFETKFTGDFLYRVGNQNTVSLGSLFAAAPKLDKDGNELKDENGETIYWDINSSGVYVTIDKVDEKFNVGGAFTTNTTDWTKGTIQFTGTGVVKVTIQDFDYCEPTVLYLEVVDAYNRTTASFSGNSVLLNNVDTSSTLSTSGVIYGNGFTVNMENAPISEKNGAVFHLYDGAILKNLGIIGKEFTTVAANVNNTDYGVSAVRAWGTVTIENCYISGCRAPVSVTGTELTIKDSVIANGVYANVDFRSGVLNLHNVTTVNEPHAVNGTTVVGLGIVGNMTASAGRKLNITGSLTQYNWVSKADCSNIKATGISDIFNSVFTDDKYAALRYTYNETTYVNTGILSLCSDFGAAAVTGIPTAYTGMDVTGNISGVEANGYVWSYGQAGTLSADDMKYHDTTYEWTPSNQGTAYIPPAFDFTAAGLEAENGVAQISYENGSSYTLSADTLKNLLSAAKYGKTLNVKISMNGEDYTGKDIVINDTASQTYTITYTIVDDQVYDKEGKLTNTTYEVTKDLKVFATVVDKSADAPTFTFYYGTNGSASAGTPHTTQPTNSYTSTIKQIGEEYYIMPNVSATTANAIGSQTVDGTTVYYPIVDGINVRSGNSMDYDFTRYYPVFKAVKISDNETEYTYSGTKEMPATVAWVSATIDSGNGASALNDGFGLYNNQYLCKIQKKAGDAESGGTSVVKFSYTALDGNTYYYYVGYRFYDEKEGCVTGDTLVTLADGTQKRIDQVTYEDQLLVWDFFNGCYTTTTASVLFNHGMDEYTIIKLKFDDGTVLKMVEEHEIFDVAENSFVYIDANNVGEYVDHEFVKAEGNGYTTVKLVDYEVYVEETEAYTILTTKHFNAILENMFTLTPDPTNKCETFFRPHEVGENMKYDAWKMQDNIRKYGLYTYAEFAEYMTRDEFDAFGISYAKFLVGKGYITYEDILTSLSTYAPNH